MGTSEESGIGKVVTIVVILLVVAALVYFAFSRGSQSEEAVENIYTEQGGGVGMFLCQKYCVQKCQDSFDTCNDADGQPITCKKSDIPQLAVEGDSINCIDVLKAMQEA
jgi:hypothetical protein